MTLLRFLSQNAPWLATGCLLTFLSCFGQTFFISIFSGQIRAEFSLSHGAWGGLYSLGTTLSALVMVWAGGLTDQFRVRTLGPVVLIGLAAACIAMAINPVVWLLPAVIFALRFFGQGMASHLAVVAMARWFVATRGKALSVAGLGFAFGEAVLPITFVALMAFASWQSLWLIAAMICVLGLPALGLLLRQERTPQSMAESYSSAGIDARHWTRKQVLGHPLFWFMVPALLGPSAFNTAFFFHQVHFSEIKGWQHVELVALFPFYTTVSILAMVLSGWALDKLGTASLMPFVQLPMVICFVTFSAANSLTAAAVGFFFLALTTGANSTLPNAFWAEFFGTAHIGSIKAMATAVMVFGSAIGPGITGLLIDLGVGLEQQLIGVAGYFLITTASMCVGISRYRAALIY